MAVTQTLSLHALAARCVDSTVVADKLALTTEIAARFHAGEVVADDAAFPKDIAPIKAPGRPDRPRLVVPRDLPRRGLASADRPESQDICFVPGGDYRNLLRGSAAEKALGYASIVPSLIDFIR